MSVLASPSGTRGGYRRLKLLVAAIAPVVGWLSQSALAGGNFDGEQLAATRLWSNPLNWDFNTLPAPADAIVFGVNGMQGSLDLGAASHTHPSFTFNDWVQYSLFNGVIASPAAGTTLSIGGGPESVYGAEYLGLSTSISGWDLGAGPSFLSFSNLRSGVIAITGPLTGTGSLTTTALSATPQRPLYLLDPSGGYSGTVNITTGTAIHLLETAPTGTGLINFQGGELRIDSDMLGGQTIANPILSSYGTIRADHNYSFFPVPVYAPGTVHTLGPVTVDNPSNLGGTNDAVITFSANNGYNFALPILTLSNTQFPLAAAGGRYVIVTNGNRATGNYGSVRQTSANRLHEQVVTTTVGAPAVPSLFDFDPFSGGGLPLLKYGTGVLAIDGDNTFSSSGIKYAVEGVLRLNTALSYGTTGGPASPVALGAGPAPVSAGMGVGYPTPVPGNLFTFGTIAGQSGAFDIDTFSGAPFAPGIVSSSAPFPMTALRLGSSGTGFIVGGVAPYDDFGLGTSTWYFGGGGGTLTMGGGWGAAAFPFATVEMGTSGMLLPGRVNVVTPLPFGPPLGMVNIRAGTLDLSPPGVVAAGAGTSLGAYSTTLGSDASYGGAPAATPFNGPGQLLLDAGTQAGFGYFYGPFGPFGAAGVVLDGGAIGWGPTLGPAPAVIPIAGIPGTYGAPLASTLYQSTAVAPAPVATNILHFGGENSTSTMSVLFPIANNGGTPVALLKSGVDSILDLRPPGFHTYTGGTGIIGGEVQVDGDPELGGPAGGAVVIADGGILHIMMSGPAIQPYSQILRVANGPSARSSIVNVDGPVTASFSIGALQASTPGSILEKTGAGTLQFLPPAIYGFGLNQNTWGLAPSGGLLQINQLPRSAGAGVASGSLVFDNSVLGGTLNLVGMGDPGFIAIPPATQYSPNYGFSGMQTKAGGVDTLTIGAGEFFRITGAQTSTLAGSLVVSMTPTSVFKIAGNAAGGDTRSGGGGGSGSVWFAGGNVQFTPGGGNILWPRDGNFLTTLDGVQFSGCPDANINGYLAFNPGGFPMCSIDAATIGVAPVAAASTWTIGGTGGTTWWNTVVKGRTEAVPGSGGPYVTGTVNFNRNLGAGVTVTAGALLDIEYGTLNAGGTGDPFTDTGTPTTHLPVINNATFNITQGYKHILSLAGVGVTTVSAGATLDVGSLGPVTQSTFTVNGIGDVGNVNVSGTTTVSGAGSSLTANYVRGNALSIGANGRVMIRPSGGSPGGVSRVETLTINTTSGNFDISDNKLIVDYSGAFPGDNSPAATIRTYLINGRGGSGLGPETWAGNGGITSSSAAGVDPTGLAVGYREAQPPDFDIDPVATFGGQTVDDTAILIRYTYSGDANLDGVVNRDDLLILQNSFNQTSGVDWLHGDFDYNGNCDRDDYNLLSNNYGNTPIPSSSFGSDFAASFAGSRAAVPEPGSLGLLGLGAAGLLGRKRRLVIAIAAGRPTR